MAIEHSRSLRIATLVTVVIAVLVSTGMEENWGMGGAAVVGTLMGFWLSWARRGKRNVWIKVGLSLGMTVAFVHFLQEAFQNPFDTRLPLAHLLIWLQTLHAFDLPRRRDLGYSLLVAFILMIVAATMSRTDAFLVPLLLFMAASWVSLWLMHLARWPATLESMPQKLQPHLFLPVSLFALVGFGVYLVLPRSDAPYVQALPVSIRLPSPPQFRGEIRNPAYPTAGGQGGQITGARIPFNPKAYYGFSYSLYLNYRGKLDDSVVMRVRSPVGLYWRGMAFDYYDGVAWSMSEPHKTRRYTSHFPPIIFDRDAQDRRGLVSRRQIVQSFYVESDQSNLVFAAPDAFSFYFPTDYLLKDRYSGIRSPITLSKGIIYTVVSNVPFFDAKILRRMTPNTKGLEQYLTLPRKLPERVRQWVKTVTRGIEGDYAKLEAISDYLQTHYRYDLDIPPYPEGRDTVDYFLFEQDAGYCEQFASALAVAGRILGVPTRLVTGYTPGRLNPLTGYREVRGSEAHAWVEVHLGRVGWVPMDPTPAAVAPQLSDSASPYGWLVVQKAAQKLAFLASPAWLVGGMGLLVVVYGAIRWDRWRRRPKDPVIRAYLDAVAFLEAKGIPRNKSQTPWEYWREVSRQSADWAESFRPLTEAYVARRYSKHVSTGEDWQTAINRLRGGSRSVP